MKKNFQKSPNWISKTLLLSTNPLRPLQNDISNPYTIYSTWELLASICPLYMVLWKVAPMLQQNNRKMKICFDSFEERCFVKKTNAQVGSAKLHGFEVLLTKNEIHVRFCLTLFLKSQFFFHKSTFDFQLRLGIGF